MQMTSVVYRELSDNLLLIKCFTSLTYEWVVGGKGNYNATISLEVFYFLFSKWLVFWQEITHYIH